MNKKDYEDFVAITGDLVPAMKESGFDIEKLMTQMDKDIDLDMLNKRLENKIKE